MKLIGSLTSPYVRKVRIVLIEKNIDLDFTVDPPFSPDNQIANVNPLGKVPVLVMADDTPLYDSRVIAEYLDSLNDKHLLIPASGASKFAVKRWEALADGIADAIATIYLEHKRPQAQQSPEWLARQQRKIDLGLQAAAADLGDQPWCAGNDLTLADIALGCTLDYLSFRFPQNPWRDIHANLAHLSDELAKRKSFRQTIPTDVSIK
ncbi:MAG: glutathione S-transferase [Nitrosomonas sp.]|nr:glutathione S-transferase [Nitrosomonas sp.]